MVDETYTYEQAKAASFDYFDGDDLATEVFITKYALRDNDGRLLELTPDDMHKRLAREFARIEQKHVAPMSEDEIYNLLKGFKRIVPQGSPMSAIGNPFKVQSLSNCFVIPEPHDSIAGIMYADQQQAQIMKRRGGVGFDISSLRPRGTPIANAAGTTDGIGVFMERYSATCRGIAQGGRRGALMLTISCRHPEVETFINIKRDLTKVTGANVSVKVTDDFMRAVKADEEFVLRWPVDVDPKDAQVTKTVRAKEVWDQIIESAWSSAEPGVLFWDAVTREGPADVFADKGFKTVSTNPCAELPLSVYDTCRLMLVNLTAYVRDPFTDKSSFDFSAFKADVKRAQRLMDDLVDLEVEAVDKIIKKIQDDPEPLYVKLNELSLWEKVRETVIEGRRTGLGVTALGDAVAMCGLVYGSQGSITFTEEIYKTLAVAAHEESVNLAEERGAFPACDPQRYSQPHPFFDRLKPHVSSKVWRSFLKNGRRNIALTTTAPAGSVSVLTQTTSGIEPAYLLQYKRRRKINQNDQVSKVDFVDAMGDKWQEYEVCHHGLQKWMEATGETDVKKSPYWGATSNDVDWLASVKLQATAQKYVEHAISKTCNVPNDATKELISQIYFTAWESGCKGFTVYRDGCRSGVLVSSDSEKKTEKSQPSDIVETHAPKRPAELECDIHKATIKGESYVVLVGLLNGKPYEIFAGLATQVETPKKAKKGTLVKNGKNKDGVVTYNLVIPVGDDDEVVLKNIVDLFDNPIHGALTRMLSLSMRHGTNPKWIAEQLRKDKASDITSFSSVIARVLSKHYVSDELSKDASCPQCNSQELVVSQGCTTCSACGYSKCQ